MRVRSWQDASGSTKFATDLVVNVAPMTAPTRQIPVVDLEDIQSGDADRTARAGAAIVEAFGHFGLVYVKNHGVDAKNVDALFDAFLQLTALEESEKKPYGRADIWFQRGWTPPNTEKAVVAGGQPDFKECWFAAVGASDPEIASMYPQIYADNIWPGAHAGFDPTAFRARYTQMGLELQSAAEGLLRGAALGLGLAPEVFVDIAKGGPHVTRLLHYLPLGKGQVGKGILWGEEHTDFNLVTVLPGGRFYDADRKSCPRPDDSSGLYLRTRPNENEPQGELVRGVAPAGCIVAQVGQQLEILTGGAMLATPHVVTAPGIPGFSRASAAHFTHAHSNETLFPMRPFRNAQSITDYSPPVLAGTYSLKTLVDIGLAPKEAIDRLGYRQYDRLGTIRATELSGKAR
jgi:isopenicillin N synthase-like dioxygenase